MSRKILIVDRHPLVREGLASVLTSALSGTQMLMAATVPAALTVLAVNEDVDLIILDPVPADIREIAELIDCIRTQPQHSAVVVLSSSEDAAEVREVARSGLSVFVSKQASIPEFLQAVHRTQPADPVNSAAVLAAGFTGRQNEVLSYLCEGRTNRLIGTTLMIAEKTVKAHLRMIFRSLGVENRTQAVIAARRLGLCRD